MEDTYMNTPYTLDYLATPSPDWKHSNQSQVLDQPVSPPSVKLKNVSGPFQYQDKGSIDRIAEHCQWNHLQQDHGISDKPVVSHRRKDCSSEPHSHPHLVAIDIDKLVRSKSASPPPLSPRLNSRDNRPPLTPPLPCTKEMFIVGDVQPLKTKNALIQGKERERPNRSARSIVSPSHRRNMETESSSSDSELVASPTHVLPPSQLPREQPVIPMPPASPRSQFLVMKNRPLPPKPPDRDNSNGFLEKFDHNPPQPQLKHQSADLRTRPLKPTVKEQWSLDTRKPQQPAAVNPSLSLPAQLSSLKDTSSFNDKDKTRLPPADGQRLPLNVPKGIWPDYIDGYVNTEPPPPGFEAEQRPSKKTSLNVPKGIWPDYIDGYVNTEPPPPGFEVEQRSSPQTRQVPHSLTPSEMKAKHQPPLRRSSDPEYDYPEMRSLLWALPNARRSEVVAKNKPIPTPRLSLTKKQDLPERDGDDSVPMQSELEDENYTSGDAIKQIRADFLGPSIGDHSQAGDDMSVYMNLPSPPSNSLPPRHQVPPTLKKSLPPQQLPSVLPRRGREAVTMEDIHHTKFSETQLRPSPIISLSKSYDEGLHSIGTEWRNPKAWNEDSSDEEGEDYVHVNASLPVGFKQRGNVSARTPVSSASKREPIEAPVIKLPPRNIIRTFSDW